MAVCSFFSLAGLSVLIGVIVVFGVELVGVVDISGCVFVIRDSLLSCFFNKNFVSVICPFFSFSGLLNWLMRMPSNVR